VEEEEEGNLSRRRRGREICGEGGGVK